MIFFKARTIIIAFSFLLTSIVLFVDNKPQRFPLPDNVESPDCFNIDILNISKDINRIQLFMRAKYQFIEFPIEAASQLIQINSESSTSSFTYYFSDFWDFNASYVKSDNSTDRNYDFLDFNFNILQPINGNISVSVFCNKIKLDKEEIEMKEDKFTSKFVSTFNFSIDRIQYYPILLSKIEFDDMNSMKINGFSIYNSNLIYHTKNIAKIKPLKIGKQNYNVSCDFTNFIKFCENSKQSYYNDEVFFVSSESINELNPQFFFSNCIFRIFYSMQKINNEIDQYFESINNLTSADNDNDNLNMINDNLDLKETENSIEKVPIKMKLLIINDDLNMKDKSIPLSEGKFKSFESLFRPDLIEIINMNEKKCFREGIVLNFEKKFNENSFLEKINDKLINISLLQNMFYDENLLLNQTKISTLIDSEKKILNEDFNFLNISENIHEIAKKVHTCNKFIVTQKENLPFALFMNEGAKLVQIGGNKLIGKEISNLTKLSNFTYCRKLINCNL